MFPFAILLCHILLLSGIASAGGTSYVYGPNGLLARVNKSGNITYFHSDHLGSHSVMTNEKGEVTSSADYLPFGLQSSDSSSKFGFTGKELDSDLGLNYFGARYYNPTTGRFLTWDNYGGQYIYARNNPLKYVDPNGNWNVLADIGKRFAGIGVGVGKGAWDTVYGVGYIVVHPVKTAKGVGFAATNPRLTAEAIAYSVKERWDAWLDPDDPYGSGLEVGKLLFEVEAAIGGAAAAKFAKARLAGKLPRLGPKLAYADDAGHASNLLDDIAGLTRDIVTKLKGGSSIDDALKVITDKIDDALAVMPDEQLGNAAKEVIDGYCEGGYKGLSAKQVSAVKPGDILPSGEVAPHGGIEFFNNMKTAHVGYSGMIEEYYKTAELTKLEGYVETFREFYKTYKIVETAAKKLP